NVMITRMITANAKTSANLNASSCAMSASRHWDQPPRHCDRYRLSQTLEGRIANKRERGHTRKKFCSLEREPSCAGFYAVWRDTPRTKQRQSLLPGACWQ